MHGVDRPIKERSSREMEAVLQGQGEYVQMSYLQRALKSPLDFETKKYALIRLAKIYEKKGMYLEAARSVKAAADINTTFKGQITDYMKVVDLYVKSGDYIEADRVFAQALALGNEREKMQMKTNLKDFYMVQAKIFLQKDKRNQAKKIFEKILTLDLEPGERNQVQNHLLEIYDKLGNIREYYKLKKEN